MTLSHCASAAAFNSLPVHNALTLRHVQLVVLFLHLEELRREDRLAVSVFLELEARGGVVAGLRLVCADNAAVFLNVDTCNAACVAVDEVYRVLRLLRCTSRSQAGKP